MNLRLLISRLYRMSLSSNQYINILKKKGMLIGPDCEIYSDADFGSEPYLISLGSHVRINGGVKFITHDGGTWILRNRTLFGKKFGNINKFGRIIIEDNVHVGTNAIIMPNVKIGENSIIACGAVVTKNFPKNSIVGGVPARIIESTEVYISKNNKDFIEFKDSEKSKQKFLEKTI